MTRLLLIHFDHALMNTDGRPLRPGAITWLGRIARELLFELLCYGRGDTSTNVPFHALVALMEGEGIRFAEALDDDTENLTAMLTRYHDQGFDLAASYVVGDGSTPLDWAREAGCRTIRLAEETDRFSSLTAPGWEEVYHFLKGRPRYVALNRSSDFSDVRITLNLDGRGETFTATGMDWCDKLLPMLASEARFDLDLRMKQEPSAKPAELADDVALAFGMAFSRGSRMSKGVGVYGFTVPYAGSLAQVAVSLQGEAHFEWKGKPEGSVSNLCATFLAGFCKHAPCTMHITTEGKEESEVLEALFKAIGRALSMAVRLTTPVV